MVILCQEESVHVLKIPSCSDATSSVLGSSSDSSTGLHVWIIFPPSPQWHGGVLPAQTEALSLGLCSTAPRPRGANETSSHVKAGGSRDGEPPCLPNGEVYGDNAVGLRCAWWIKRIVLTIFADWSVLQSGFCVSFFF